MPKYMWQIERFKYLPMIAHTTVALLFYQLGFPGFSCWQAGLILRWVGQDLAHKFLVVIKEASISAVLVFCRILFLLLFVCLLGLPGLQREEREHEMRGRCFAFHSPLHTSGTVRNRAGVVVHEKVSDRDRGSGWQKWKRLQQQVDTNQHFCGHYIGKVWYKIWSSTFSMLRPQ